MQAPQGGLWRGQPSELTDYFSRLKCDQGERQAPQVGAGPAAALPHHDDGGGVNNHTQ